VLSLLKRLWIQINSNRRRQFGLLLLLTLFASFAEMISIGLVLPFLGVLAAPDKIDGGNIGKYVIQVFGISSSENLLLLVTIIFVVAVVIAGSMRLFLMWASTRLTYAVGADLSFNIYQRTLFQPYEAHCARNSSEIISGISTKVAGTIGIVNAILSFISSIILLIGVLSIVFIVEPLVATSVFFGFSLIYVFVAFFSKRKLLLNSQLVAKESTQVIKSLQEGLGGIRDVLIGGFQSTYCKIYSDADFLLRRAQASTQFIKQSPRYFIEMLGVVLIVSLAYVFTREFGKADTSLPVIGVIVVGAQRLLPLLQQIYMAWVSVRSEWQSLEDTLNLLEQDILSPSLKIAGGHLKFHHKIQLKNVSFSYNYQNSFTIKGIDLIISKGSRVGIVGKTGSGKSTLVDIIMGLLDPDEGSLEVDGQVITVQNKSAWQSHIAHVPQAIYLIDSTIAENIAFGIPKELINMHRVEYAAKEAQLADVIEAWPEMYQTIIGERGIRLSGGQRQRIGIARALYKQADVIIFDEATSALDAETEEAVMQSIKNLSRDLTLIIIAHRLSTLEICTEIIQMHKGFVKQ
jgi:ATP-binding cassette, subfamily B, bacterial PglK